MKDDKVYLQHILDSIFRIEEYTRGVEYKDFISARRGHKTPVYGFQGAVFACSMEGHCGNIKDLPILKANVEEIMMEMD